MVINLRRDNTKKKKSNKLDLNHKKICFSGTIPGYARVDAIALLKRKYPDVLFTTNITKTVDILLVGHGVGQSKLLKAKEYNITIIEALDILNG